MKKEKLYGLLTLICEVIWTTKENAENPPFVSPALTVRKIAKLIYMVSEVFCTLSRVTRHKIRWSELDTSFFRVFFSRGIFFLSKKERFKE